MTKIHAVIFDVDGTLVDSNDAHAHAWVEAMAENGQHVSLEQIGPLIGMGGDKVLPETIHVEKESPLGKAISEKRKEIFKTRYLSHIKAFPKTKELLEKMHQQGLKLLIATSAEPDELKQLLRAIDEHAYDLFSQEASSKDAQSSKPDSDVLQAVLEKGGYEPEEVFMIGDTGYDIESATKLGVRCIAFRSGGWKDQDLKGAMAIYDGPADLLEQYARSPLADAE